MVLEIVVPAGAALPLISSDEMPQSEKVALGVEAVATHAEVEGS